MHVHSIGDILKHDPSARVVLIVRDGRDVAASLARRGFPLDQGTGRCVRAAACGLPWATGFGGGGGGGQTACCTPRRPSSASRPACPLRAALALQVEGRQCGRAALPGPPRGADGPV